MRTLILPRVILTLAAVLCSAGLGSASPLPGDTPVCPLSPALSARDPALPIPTMGEHHTCLLRQSSSLECFGRGSNGRLGRADGSLNHWGDGAGEMMSVTPVAFSVAAGDPIVEAVTGIYHTCGRSLSGKVYCTGHSNQGQTGYNQAADIGDLAGEVTARGAVSFWDPSVKAVSLGANLQTTCAVVEGAAVEALGNPALNVLCWGQNNHGRFGQRTTSAFGYHATVNTMAILRPVPFPNDGHRVVQVSVGWTHNCYLFDHGRIRCRGNGDLGANGRGNSAENFGDQADEDGCGDYVTFGTTHRAVQVVSGHNANCVLFEGDGGPGTPRKGIRCWGRGGQGMLMRGDDVTYGTTHSQLQSIVFIPFANDGKTPISLTMYYEHVCALFTEHPSVLGSIRCWGEGSNGRLASGNGADVGRSDTSTADSVDYVPIPAVDHSNIAHVVAGRSATCATGGSGQVYCFGYNGYGLLGAESPNGNIGDDYAEITEAAFPRVAPMPAPPAAASSTLLAALDASAPALIGPHGSHSFCPTTFSYDRRHAVSLPSWRPGIPWISATCADPGCSVSVSGSGPAQVGTGSVTATDVDIPAGDSLVTIVVTAADGVTTSSYTVHVRRAQPQDSSLAGLEIVHSNDGVDGGVQAAHDRAVAEGRETADLWRVTRQVFDPAVTTHTLRVTGGRPAVFISALCADPAATATVRSMRSWLSLDRGSAGVDPLIAGPSVGRATDEVGYVLPGFGTSQVVVTVSSADGSASTNYTLRFRASHAPTAPGADVMLVHEDMQVVMAEESAFALRGGYVLGWGYNGYGQLGTDSNTQYGDNTGEVNGLSSIQFADAVGMVQISSNLHSICALTREGKIRCWGRNDNAQLGYDATDHRGNTAGEMVGSVPYLAFGHSFPAVKLSHSKYASCALFSNGRIICWGYNGYGGLGVDATDMRGNTAGEMAALPFIPYTEHAVDVATGRGHACALFRSGRIRCWGRNDVGQLARGNTAHWGNNPQEVSEDPDLIEFSDTVPAVKIASFKHTTCAVFANGRARCWGENNNGELGAGDTSSTGATSPKNIPYLVFQDMVSPEVDDVDVGNDFVCFRFAHTGVLRCHGYNGYGQLGVGATMDIGSGFGHEQCAHTIPFASPGNRVSKFSIGTRGGCAVLEGDGHNIRCWGTQGSGRLGLAGGQPGIHPGSAPGQIESLGRVDIRADAFGGTASPPPTDPALADLADSLGVIGAFSPTVTVYGPVVFATEAPAAGAASGASPVPPPSSITITAATCRAAGCAVSHAPGSVVPLVAGLNTIPVVATSASGTRQATYTLLIRIVPDGSASSDASLASLWDSLGATIGSDANDPTSTAFDPAQTWYPAPASVGVAHVAPDTRYVSIRAACADPGCTVEVRSTVGAPADRVIARGDGGLPTRFHEDDSEGAAVHVPLSTRGGRTVVTVTVTAADGTSTASYQLAYEAACPAMTPGEMTPPAVRVDQPVIWHSYRLSTCVVRNGEVFCYGFNDWGQLGQDSTATLGNNAGEVSLAAPIAFSTSHPAVSVACGDSHTCAIFATAPDGSANRVRCWGYNAYGNLGVGAADHRGNQAGEMATLPFIDFGPLSSYNPIDVSLGVHHTCVLFSSGRVNCFGRHTHGQLLTHAGRGVRNENIGNTAGEVSLAGPIVFNEPSIPAVQVSAGDYHSCALFANGRARCWGLNNYGQLGMDNTDYFGDEFNEVSPPFIRFKDTVRVAQVEAGYEHTCFLFVNGRVRCVGRNDRGQLGQDNASSLGSGTVSLATSKIDYVEFGDAPAIPVASVHVGELHTCGLFLNGRIRCWGYGGTGAVGRNRADDVGKTSNPSVSRVPFIELPPGATRATAVRCGNHFTCALYDGSDAPWCWGDSSYGRLGRSDGGAMGNLGQAAGEMSLVEPVDFPPAFGGTSAATDPALADLEDSLGFVGAFCPTVTLYGPYVLGGHDPVTGEPPASTPPTSVTITTATCRAAGCAVAPAVGAGIPLSPGLNTISLVSTSASGSHQVTYTILIRVISPLGSDASLATLWDSLGAVPGVDPAASESEPPATLPAAPDFDPAVLVYPISGIPLPTADATVDVAAACSDPGCTIEIGPVTSAGSIIRNTSTVWAGGIPIPRGGTLNVQVLVRSADATATTAYTLRYERLCELSEARGVAGVPPPTVLDQQYRHVGFISQGRVVAWGYSGYRQLTWGGTADQGNAAGEIAGLTFATFSDTVPAVSIGVGSHHTCVLFGEGSAAKVRCWGRSNRGQLGNGATATVGTTVDLANLPYISFKEPTWRPVQIAVGAEHTCVLMELRGVVCFGRNYAGAIGSGNGNNVGDNAGEMASLDILPLPETQSSPSVPIVRIAAGCYHTCAVYADGRLLCFGFNDLGQLGRGHSSHIGDNVDEIKEHGFVEFKNPASVDPVIDVSLGYQHTCALFASGGVICFGRNSEAELGQGDTASRGMSPGQIANLDYIKLPGSVAASRSGSGADSLPVPGSGRLRAVKLVSGYYHNCVILRGADPDLDRRITCWGHGSYGGVGGESSDHRGDKRGEVDTGFVNFSDETLRAAAISAGEYSTCALFTNNKIYCWGRGDNGVPGRADGSGKHRGDENGEMSTLSPVDLSAAILPAATPAPVNSPALEGLTETLEILRGFCPGTLAYGPFIVAHDPAVTSVIFTANCDGGTSCSVSFNGGAAVAGPSAVSAAIPIPASGPASFGISVTSQDGGTTRSYTVDIIVTSLSDATLVALNDSLAVVRTNAPAPSLQFDPAVTTYGPQYVGILDTSIDVFLTCAALGCTARVTGVTTVEASAPADPQWPLLVESTETRLEARGVGLGPGANHVRVEITSPDAGTTSTYTLIVVRPCLPSERALRGPRDIPRRKLYVGYKNVFVLAEGRILAWGQNNYGQLGLGHNRDQGDGTTGDTMASLAFLSFSDAALAIQISVAETATCAVFDVSGVRRARCWGRNDYGQLGIGSNVRQGNDPGDMATLPYIIFSDAVEIAQISVSHGVHTCGIFSNGGVRCWGHNGNGRLGRPSFPSGGSNQGDASGEMATLPYIPLSGTTVNPVVRIATPQDSTCVLRQSGAVQCFGRGDLNTLGTDSQAHIGNHLMEVAPTLKFTDEGALLSKKCRGADGGYTELSSLYRHTCLIGECGQVRCFGPGGSGRTGLGHSNATGHEPLMNPLRSSRYLEWPDVGFVKQVSAGQDHTCIVSGTGTVRCWGNGANGRTGRILTANIGDNPREMEFLDPVSFTVATKVVEVGAGDGFTCALFDAPGIEIRCFGVGSNGRTGLDTTATLGDTAVEWAALQPVDISAVTVPPSADARLSALQEDSGVAAAFCPDVTVYGSPLVVDVAFTALSFTTAQCEVAGCSISISGGAAQVGTHTGASVPLVAGLNEVPVAVTAANGISRQTYTVRLYLPTVPVLGALGDSAGAVASSGGYSPATLVYGAPLLVLSSQSSVDLINASCVSHGCTIRVDWRRPVPTAQQLAAPDGQPFPVVTSNYASLGADATSPNLELWSAPLVTGLNEYIFTVRLAEDILESQYTLRYQRPSPDAVFLSISDSFGLVGQPFDRAVTAYPAAAPAPPHVVPSSVDSIDWIHALCSYPACVITVDVVTTVTGQPAQPLVTAATGTGTFNASVPLDFGLNDVVVNVASEDGSADEAYLLRVYRESSDAALADIGDSVGVVVSAAGGFSPVVNAYGTPFSVASTTTELGEVNATCSYPLCQISIDGAAAVAGFARAVSIPLVTGTNTVVIQVTSEDGAQTSTYTLLIDRVLGGVDVTLAVLEDSLGYVGAIFTPGATQYPVPSGAGSVPFSVSSIPSIRAVAKDPLARVSIDGGPQELNETTALGVPLPTAGLHVVTVFVNHTGPPAGTLTYQITYRRESNVATLSALGDGGIGAVTGFVPAGKTYPVSGTPHNVPHATSSFTVSATCTHALCSVRTSSPAGASSTGTLPSTSVPLAVGDNSITVEVVSEDASVTDTYTILVRRQSNVATLSSLADTPTGFVAGTPFSAAVTAYSGSVLGSVSQVASLAATCTHPGCQVSVAGGAAQAGSSSVGPLAMTTGLNDFHVDVTSEDGSATMRYTLTIRRMSSDASLSILTDTLGIVASTGPFSGAVTSYGAPYIVEEPVSAIGSVAATCSNPRCSVRIGAVAPSMGSASRTNVPVFSGPNTIDVAVTSEDGSASETYFLLVTKIAAANDSSAVSITDALGASAGFDPLTAHYGPVVVPGATAVLASLGVTCAHQNCTIRINDDPTSPHTGAVSLTNWPTLDEGTNIVTVNITSSDGSQVTSYTLEYYRASADASLASLFDTAGCVDGTTGGFSPGATVYGLAPVACEVAPIVSSIVKVNASCSHPKCSVSVAGETATEGEGAALAISLVTGANVVAVTATSEDGAVSSTYSIHILRVAGTGDADLSNLVDSIGIVAAAGPFASATTVYGAPTPHPVAASVTNIPTITATCVDPYCQVRIGLGPVGVGSSTVSGYTLAYGDNVVPVSVTSSDTTGSVTYRIHIRRQSGNAALASLTDSLNVTGAFSPAVLSYGVSPIFVVPTTTTTLASLSAACSNSFCSISFNGGAAVLGGTLSVTAVPLAVGVNTFTVEVTSEDGTVTNPYSLSILREGSSDASLASLSTDPPIFPALAPAFDPGVTSYGVLLVPHTVTEIANVNATANVTTAVVRIGAAGTPALGTAFESSIPLPSSVTTAVDVLVTSEDGLETRAYTFSVRRGSADATALSIRDSLGATTGSFDPTVFSYGPVSTGAAVLGNVTVTCGDPFCAIFVAGVPAGTGTAVATDVPLGAEGTTTNVVVRIDAEDGTATTSYTIRVRRPSGDSSLVALADDLGVMAAQNFSSTTLAYAGDANPANATAAAITATCGSPSCVMTVNAVPAASGSTVLVPLPSAGGSFSVRVVVVSESGSSTTTYSVTFSRPASAVVLTDVLAADITAPGTPGAGPTPAALVLGPSPTFDPAPGAMTDFSVNAPAGVAAVRLSLTCNAPCDVAASMPPDPAVPLALLLASREGPASHTIALTGLVSPGVQLAIRVSPPAGTSGADMLYTADVVIAPFPPVIITALDPESGPPLTLVTLTGTGFGRVRSDIASVTLAGFTCIDMARPSADELVCSAGMGRGAGPARVVTVWGSAGVSSADFTFTAPTTNSSRPLAWFLSPAQGPASGGTLVTVVGVNLGASTADLVDVALAGVSCATTKEWLSATMITCVSEATVSPTQGPVSVTTALGGRSDTDGATSPLPPPVYTYEYPVPVVREAHPRVVPVISAGPGSPLVTVRGEYFGPPGSNVELRIDGAPCLETTWVSETEITCLPPPAPDGRASPPGTRLLLSVVVNGVASTPSDVGYTAGFVYGVPCEPQCGWYQECIEASCGVCAPRWVGESCETRWLSISTDGDRRITTEDGGTDVLTVEVAAGPEVAVLVNVSVPGEARADPERVAFGASDPDDVAPRVAVVTIVGLPDAVRDGSKAFEVSLRPDPSLSPPALLAGRDDPPLRYVNWDSAPVVDSIEPSAVLLEGGIVTVRGINWDLAVGIRVGGDNVTEYNRLMAAGVETASPGAAVAAQQRRRGGFPSPMMTTTMRRSTGGRRALALQQVQQAQRESAGEDAVTIRVPPRSERGYSTLVLTNLDGREAVVPDVVFYTSGCTRPGFLARGTECVECPTGAECPGGDRLWPLPGYWNPSEDAGFVQKCTPRESCLGHRGGASVALACEIGYEGHSCGACSEDFYRSPVGTCLACPSNDFLVVYLIADVLLWTVFGLLGVVIRDRMAYSYVVMTVRAIQSLAGVGAMADEDTPRWAVAIMEVLHLFSGDISFVRPDCIEPVPHLITFAISVAYTLALATPLFLFLGLAALVTMRKRSSLAEDDPARYFYRDRAVRGVFIMLTVAYLPIATVAIDALSCNKGRMITRPDVVCYQGDHIIATALACFLIATLIIGYPLFVLRHLRRNEDRLHVDERFMERWNFFYEFYNPNYPTFWIIEYPIMIIVAAGQSILRPHVNYQMSISVAVFATKLLYIVARRPFIDWLTDVIQAVMALVSLVVINMTFFSRHGFLDKIPAVREIITVAIFGIFALAVVGLIVFIVYLMINPNSGQAARDKYLKSKTGEGSETEGDLYAVDVDEEDTEAAGELSILSMFGGGAVSGSTENAGMFDSFLRMIGLASDAEPASGEEMVDVDGDGGDGNGGGASAPDVGAPAVEAGAQAEGNAGIGASWTSMLMSAFPSQDEDPRAVNLDADDDGGNAEVDGDGDASAAVVDVDVADE